jgi:hypothetical protein
VRWVGFLSCQYISDERFVVAVRWAPFLTVLTAKLARANSRIMQLELPETEP